MCLCVERLLTRAIHLLCADELIRQITVNCAERGLLLLRVRDEIRMTVAAYQALYESSIAFGMRKALMAEQKKSELHTKVRRGARARCPGIHAGTRTLPLKLFQIQVMTAEVAELEGQVAALGTRCEEMEALEKERFAADEDRHAQEVAKLRAVNDQLKDSLEALLAPPAMKK